MHSVTRTRSILSATRASCSTTSPGRRESSLVACPTMLLLSSFGSVYRKAAFKARRRTGRFFTPAGTIVLIGEEAAQTAHAHSETEWARAEAERALVQALEAENTRLLAGLERLHGSIP